MRCLAAEPCRRPASPRTRLRSCAAGRRDVRPCTAPGRAQWRARGAQGRTQVVAAAAVEEDRPPAARALDALRGILAHGDRACRAVAFAASSALPAPSPSKHGALKRARGGRRARLCRPPARSPGGPRHSTPAPRARRCTRARPAGAAAGRWVGLGLGLHGHCCARARPAHAAAGRCAGLHERAGRLHTGASGGAAAAGRGPGLPAQQAPGGGSRAAEGDGRRRTEAGSQVCTAVCTVLRSTSRSTPAMPRQMHSTSSALALAVVRAPAARRSRSPQRALVRARKRHIAWADSPSTAARSVARAWSSPTLFLQRGSTFQ
jgi:hypothetical protein